MTHYHIHSPLRIAIRTMVATMEFPTVAGARDAVSRNKGGTELAAIALAWFTLDIIVEKGFFGWENETTGGRENTMLVRSEV